MSFKYSDVSFGSRRHRRRSRQRWLRWVWLALAVLAGGLLLRAAAKHVVAPTSTATAESTHDEH